MDEEENFGSDTALGLVASLIAEEDDANETNPICPKDIIPFINSEISAVEEIESLISDALSLGKLKVEKKKLTDVKSLILEDGDLNEASKIISTYVKYLPGSDGKLFDADEGSKSFIVMIILSYIANVIDDTNEEIE